MIRSLVPYHELTRGLTFGASDFPQFRVCRTPLSTQDITVGVGEVVPADLFGRTRLRQLYEQRRIEPAIAPRNTKQAMRATPFLPVTGAPLSEMQPVVPTSIAEPLPVTVSNAVVAEVAEVVTEVLFDFPSVPVPVPVPVSEESSSYRPVRDPVRKKGEKGVSR